MIKYLINIKEILIKKDLIQIRLEQMILFKDFNNKEIKMYKIKIKEDLILVIEYLFDK